MLTGVGKLGAKVAMQELFNDLQAPVFQILPLNFEVASDAASMWGLRDPADRAIVATARVHRLQLVTSDLQIIESKLIPVVA